MDQRTKGQKSQPTCIRKEPQDNWLDQLEGFSFYLRKCTRLTEAALGKENKQLGFRYYNTYNYPK